MNVGYEKRRIFGNKNSIRFYLGEIHRKAAPYLDTRQNDIHVSISYDFARRLLAFLARADEEIVLPTIIAIAT